MGKELEQRYKEAEDVKGNSGRVLRDELDAFKSGADEVRGGAAH